MQNLEKLIHNLYIKFALSNFGKFPNSLKFYKEICRRAQSLEMTLTVLRLKGVDISESSKNKLNEMISKACNES